MTIPHAHALLAARLMFAAVYLPAAGLLLAATGAGRLNLDHRHDSVST